MMMTIEINGMTAANARDITNTINSEVGKPLTIVCAKIIEKFIMPAIKFQVSQGNDSAIFTVARKHGQHFENINELLKELETTTDTTYYFNDSFNIDNHITVSASKITKHIILMLENLGYKIEEGYNYSSSYWKDYDFYVEW